MIKHIMHSQIMQNSHQHSIFTSWKQHGFRAQHSTKSKLILKINDIITSAFEKGKIVQLALFGKVQYEPLLNKIQY